MPNLEAEDRASTFVAHAFSERVVDLGEIRMNYATVGSSELPALVFIPAQTDGSGLSLGSNKLSVACW
jgi:hypothetical protein